ncbi:MAG: aminodeoxychorismate synthase component I [Bryobacterales bacterium]|nr:aminodeoxychorismate synthase component I [Bryobacterales bacterium]
MMKIPMPALIVDNYDSFTYNLVHAVAEITQCAPIVVRNDEKTWEEIRRLDFDSVIVSPGPGRPENPRDFGVSAQVIAEATVPVLGVCLGHQGIAHHFGGRVVRAAEPVHGRSAEILHHGDELFAGIPERFSAIRYHSLIVAEPLPPELKKIAWTADGAVMALRHVTLPIWGVQFHPESILTEYGSAILCNFLASPYLTTRLTTRLTARPTKLPTARRTIHVHARQIPLPASPETLFRRLFSEERYAFWLDSSMPSESSRFSFMGTGSEVLVAPYLDSLDRSLSDIQVDAPSLPFAFLGGYVGYLGYELKSECGAPGKHRSPLPDAILLRVDRFLAIDHVENTLWIVSCGEPDRETEKRIAALIDASKDCPKPYASSAPVQFKLATERCEYLRHITECQARIAAGDSYEICLTNQLRIETWISPLAYYERLRKLNPAPHSAYLHLHGIDVACSSPERFLRIDTTGQIESRPIKGTIRRGINPQEDAALRASLASSEKNRAENLMIVDLVRNDLARVCIPGSVRVPRMMQVETYATVHQLVSTIVGQLAPGVTAVDCIRAAFPGGSMTGAPKLRTLEILDELEPMARGIYSGSIGYIGFNGAMDLNIVIRTAVFHQGVATIGVGGAIVYQSNPEDEWDEMLLKAQAPLSAFSGKLS